MLWQLKFCFVLLNCSTYAVLCHVSFRCKFWTAKWLWLSMQNDCDRQCFNVKYQAWITLYPFAFTPLHGTWFFVCCASKWSQHSFIFTKELSDDLLSLQKNCLMIYNQNSFIFWLKFFYILTDETTVSGQYVEGECSIYLCINMLQTTVCWVLFHWWWFMQLTYWSLSPNGSKCMRSLVPFK
jgi:hypothetical protein